MCNPMAAALIGGGAILQTMGQQRGVAAQIAEQDAARTAVMRAQDAARDRALDMSHQIITRGIMGPQTGDVGRELAQLGITGGETAQAIRQIRSQGVPQALADTDQQIRMDMRELDSQIGDIRTGLDLELRPHAARMRRAGMSGNALRFLGQAAGIGGQAVLANAAYRPPLPAQDAPVTAAQDMDINTRLGRAFDPRSDLDLLVRRQQQEGLR